MRIVNQQRAMSNELKAKAIMAGFDVVHPTLRDRAAKDGVPEHLGLGCRLEGGQRPATRQPCEHSRSGCEKYDGAGFGDGAGTYVHRGICAGGEEVVERSVAGEGSGGIARRLISATLARNEQLGAVRASQEWLGRWEISCY